LISLAVVIHENKRNAADNSETLVHTWCSIMVIGGKYRFLL